MARATSPTVSAAAPLTPYADAAEFNTDFGWEKTPGLGVHIEDLIGTTVRGKPVLPQGDNVPGTVRWQLDAGAEIDVGSDGIITYNFFDFRHALGQNNNPSRMGQVLGEGPGYTPFTPEQEAAARIAIQNWDDLIAPEFKEQPDMPGAKEFTRTDIQLANTYTGPAQAWGYYPGDGKVESDVWIADPRFNTSNAQFLPGQYGLQTLNHELGHTLGLSHPGTYDFGDDQDGDGQPDPITYTGDAQYFQDSHQFTIMSYFDSYETGAQNIDWNLMRFVYPSTPMVDDVYVIQQKYGAEMSTRTGDTTYGFNATADVTNEAMRFHTDEMFTLFTIWDAGGKDTLDLSGYHTSSIIDLREGAYSSAGGVGAYDPSQLGDTLTLEQINANNADAGFGPRTERLYEIYFNGDWSDDGGATLVNDGKSWKEITGTGDDYLMEQNIGIAYGAVIENAIGGYGDDRINGNQVNNTLTGGGGADTFIFVNDGSVDTITDFQTGVDDIDLSEIAGINASRVMYDAAGHQLLVNADGVGTSFEMVIKITTGTVNVATDVIYA